MNQAQAAYTSGSISNATGNTIVFVTSHDWEGAVDKAHAPYPKVINNGQVGQFSHSGKNSKAAVVYHGGQRNGRQYEFMLAWKNDNPTGNNNKVYAMIREQGHNWQVEWNKISSYLDSASSGSVYMDTNDGWNSSVSISFGRTVSFGATLGPAHPGMVGGTSHA